MELMRSVCGFPSSKSDHGDLFESQDRLYEMASKSSAFVTSHWEQSNFRGSAWYFDNAHCYLIVTPGATKAWLIALIFDGRHSFTR